LSNVVPLPTPEPAAEERPVLVLDCGGQYSQLIARRVRECRVYSELVPHGISPEELGARSPLALVLSGGPASVYAEGAPKVDPRIFELGIPTLGICYGMQLMAQELGGRVERTGVSEFGKTELVAEESALFANLPSEQIGWMSHRDSVTAPPAGSRVVASSSSTPIAAFEDPERRLYGVQFHPEVVHTPYGNDLLKNFLYSVADAPATWTAAAVIEEQVERIRAQVGNERGRGAPRLQGCRRPADLRLRRPWPAAEGRGGAGRRDVPQPLPRPAGARRGRGAVPLPSCGCERSRGQAPRDR
jgi:GMP synthase (glutamine-hydrolysing)